MRGPAGFFDRVARKSALNSRRIFAADLYNMWLISRDAAIKLTLFLHFFNRYFCYFTDDIMP